MAWEKKIYHLQIPKEMCPSGAVLHGLHRVSTVSIDLRPVCRRFHFQNKIIIIIIYATSCVTFWLHGPPSTVDQNPEHLNEVREKGTPIIA